LDASPETVPEPTAVLVDPSAGRKILQSPLGRSVYDEFIFC